MPRVFARALIGLLSLVALLELILLPVFVVLLSANRVHRLLPFSLRSINAFDSTLAKASLVDIHNLVEFSLIHIVALVFNTLFELGDLLKVFFLLLMFVLHLKVL